MKRGFVQNRTISSNGYCQGKKKKKKKSQETWEEGENNLPNSGGWYQERNTSDRLACSPLRLTFSLSRGNQRRTMQKTRKVHVHVSASCHSHGKGLTSGQ